MVKQQLNYAELSAITLIFILLFLAVLVWCAYRWAQMKPTTEVEYPPVACEESNILTAWIKNYPVSEGCPPWTNNLIVTGNYQLWQAPVGQSGDCCYFDFENKIIQPVPKHCVVSTVNGRYPLNSLNEKLYIDQGSVISFNYAPCRIDQKCIVLTLGKTLEDNQGGIYKITTYLGSQTIDVETDMLRYDFWLADNCGPVLAVYDQGVPIILYDSNTGQYVFYTDQIPLMVREVLNGNYSFAPLAGVDDIAVVKASGQVYV